MDIQWLKQHIFNGGITTSDSTAKARAIRISNVIAFSAIGSSAIIGLLFLYLNDLPLFYTCMAISLTFSTALMISLLGFTWAGRFGLLAAANFFVFYFASLFRGQSNFQLFFYSLSVTAFTNFSWEERKSYALIALPIFLFFVGEFGNWDFFQAHGHNYNLHYIRLLILVIPLTQTLVGFYYFVKQSNKFERESNEILKKLELEHKKQIHVQKFSSLGEMAAGVSHEINNPLMVIIGKTYNLKRILKNKLHEKDFAFTELDKIDSMVFRITKIIQSLRNFSRNTEGDPYEEVELKSILETSLDLCRERFASNGIKLEINADNKLRVLCRPSEIVQVLVNLLNNAIDASQSRPDAKVLIFARKIGHQIEIIVEDNGTGIPTGIEDKIMQPFFTTKDVGKGTGLGLSTSKGLIESHQGTLALIPTTGKTTFQILLPDLVP